MIMRLTLPAAALIAVTWLTGCSSLPPVHNVDQAPVNYTLSSEQVERAILRAGQARGWTMRVASPGVIHGDLAVRSHVAKVAIDYTAKSYSIRYLDSNNLDYDGTGIHHNYNKWVIYLNRQIQRQLDLAANR